MLAKDISEIEHNATYRGRGRRRRRRWRSCFLRLDDLDVVSREEALLRAVRADAGPPALVELLNLLDELALDKFHLVIFLCL